MILFDTGIYTPRSYSSSPLGVTSLGLDNFVAMPVSYIVGDLKGNASTVTTFHNMCKPGPYSACSTFENWFSQKYFSCLKLNQTRLI